jgi:hypothetical protein
MVRKMSFVSISLLVLFVALFLVSMIPGVISALKIWVQGATPNQIEELGKKYPDAKIIVLDQPLAVPAPPQLPPDWRNNWSAKGRCITPKNSYRKNQFYNDISNAEGNLRITFTSAGNPFYVSVDEYTVRIARFLNKDQIKIYQIPKDIFLKYLGSSIKRSVVEASLESITNAIANGMAPGFEVAWTTVQVIDWLGLNNCE